MAWSPDLLVRNGHSPSTGFTQVGGEALGLLFCWRVNFGQLWVSQFVRPFSHAVVNGEFHGQVQMEKGREGGKKGTGGWREHSIITFVLVVLIFSLLIVIIIVPI